MRLDSGAVTERSLFGESELHRHNLCGQDAVSGWNCGERRAVWQRAGDGQSHRVHEDQRRNVLRTIGVNVCVCNFCTFCV